MPFESKPRIKFHNDPLVEVVSQFTFVSAVQGINEAENLIKLHNLIKDKLPLFKRAKNVSLNVNTEDQSVSQIEKPVYEFSSIDEKVKVIIDAESITCITTNYQSKEDFFNYIFEVYNALKQLQLVNPFKRVGLRYNDVIQRSSLGEGFQNVAWNELLKAPLISVFNDTELSKAILGVQSNLTIGLDSIGQNSKMTVNYGIVNHAQTQEQCFMINSDFYSEGVFDYDSATEFLYAANIKSRDFFQWCIQPKLFDALNPESLE